MNRIAKVHAAFKEAGLDFDITHFDHRLIAQKLVYIIQELGVRLGYEGTYGFTLRGTYSPTLTKDLFDAAASPQDMPQLSKKEQQVATQIAQTTKLRPHILEVMAAYRFLRTHGKDDAEAIRLIKTRKPFISPRDIGIAITKCKRIWSEVTTEDIESLRAEMEPWERATAQDTDFA